MKRILTTWTVCLILSIGLAAAQVAKVTGWVVSEEGGEPVIGATVLVKGTAQGTITDADGKFELKNLPKEAKTLQISFVGMQTQEVTIQPNLRIVLKPETELLEEVVVTGYGVTKKAAFTGAATTSDRIPIYNITCFIFDSFHPEGAALCFFSSVSQVCFSESFLCVTNSRFRDFSDLEDGSAA